MKIGLLTLPLHTNYGGILQAYALQKVLIDMGHEVYLLTYQPRRKVIKEFIKGLKTAICVLFKGANYISIEECKRRSSKNIDQFVNEQIVNRIYFSSENDLASKGFDAFIVGSDQVWRYEYLRESLPIYFFSLAKSLRVKKYSYAASFGTDVFSYPKDIAEECKALINHFEKVSVREVDAVNLCREFFHVKADWHLDPTMLLTKDDYLFDKVQNCSRMKIVTFILDPDTEKSNIIKKVEESIGDVTFPVNAQEYIGNNACSVVELPSVYDWLQNIANAGFIVTDSFHGTAFAINFNVPFVVIGNKQRGLSRIMSLLDKFSLENRLLQNISTLENIISNQIEWDNVNKLLREYRRNSMSYLENIK